MLRFAILSARGRLATFAGAFIALFASSALVMAGGMPFESALRTHPPVERYAGAAAVVAGQQVVGTDDDVPLGERARVSSALTPYELSAGRPPAGPGEAVTGYPAALGAKLRLASTEAARTVTVVGVAR